MNKFTLPLFLILTFFTNYQSVISQSTISNIDDWYGLSIDNSRNMIEDYHVQDSILQLDTSIIAKKTT